MPPPDPPYSTLQILGLDGHDIPERGRILLCSPEDHQLLAYFTWRLLLTNPRLHTERPTRLEALTVRANFKGWTIYPHHLVQAGMAGLNLLPLLSDPPRLYSTLDPFRASGSRTTTPINGYRFDVRRENLHRVAWKPRSGGGGEVLEIIPSTTAPSLPSRPTPPPSTPPSTSPESMNELLKNVFGLNTNPKENKS